jgi:hypothetical protein
VGSSTHSNDLFMSVAGWKMLSNTIKRSIRKGSQETYIPIHYLAVKKFDEVLASSSIR